MSEGTSYLAKSFMNHSVYIHVLPVTRKPEINQTTLRLGMYVVNEAGSVFTSAGSSYLGIDAYNGGAAQRRTFTAPNAALGTTWLIRDMEVTVNHAADGTATRLPIAWHWNINAGMIVTTTGTVYIDLEPLDLASTPSASPFFCPIGQTLTITIDRVNSRYRHVLSYILESASGLIAEDVGNRITWTVPETLLTAITRGTQDTCTINCATYDGDTYLGTKVCAFIVQVGKAGAITVKDGWYSLRPDGDHTVINSWGVYVDGYSRVRALIDKTRITFSPGAELKDITMEVSGKVCQEPWLSDVLTGTHAHTVRLVITDSRGTQFSVTQSLTPLPYNPPTLAGMECYRALMDGTANDAGNYLWAVCTPVYSPVGGHNSAQVWLNLYSAADTLLDRAEVIGAGVFFGDLDAQSSYRAVLEITDAVGKSGSVSFLIPTQSVAFQIKEGGDGAAFGGLATESDCLDVHWTRLKVGGDELRDFPVESGRSGIWTYRKWRSGLAECWGSLTGTANAGEGWESLYMTKTASAQYPFTFIQAPVVQATAACTGGESYWLGSGADSGSSTQTPTYHLLSPMGIDIIYRLELYALGQWK